MAGQPRAHKIVQALAEAETLTTAQLAKVTAIPRKRLATDCERLRLRGYVERVRTGVFRATKAGRAFAATGEIVKCGPCQPHTGRRRAPEGLRTRAWRAIATMDKFTVPDLIEYAANGDERNPANNLQRYLRALVQCGYLSRLRVREQGTSLTSNGFLRYLRLKHTGPEAPVLSERKKTLYDPNTGETFELTEGSR